MTNLDVIRELDVDKFAEMFYKLSNYGEYCAIPGGSCDCDRDGVRYEDCLSCCKAWLKEKVVLPPKYICRINGLPCCKCQMSCNSMDEVADGRNN